MSQLVERRIAIHCPVRKVYDFHAFPPHLKLVQPFHLRVLSVEMPDELLEGATVGFDLLAFGLLRQSWRVRLERLEPPRGTPAMAWVAGIALRSPFAQFRYVQEMAAEAENRTVLTERVEWAPPWPVIGRLAAPILARELEAALVLRQRATKRILEAAEQPIGMPGNAADAAAYLAIQQASSTAKPLTGQDSQDQQKKHGESA